MRNWDDDFFDQLEKSRSQQSLPVQTAAPAEPVDPNQTDPTWEDYGRTLLMGFNSVGEGLSYTAKKGAELVGLDSVAEQAAAFQDLNRRAIDYMAKGLSPYAKQEIAKQFIESSPDGYKLGDASWDTVKLAMAQSAAGTAAGIGLGGLLTKGAQLVPGVSKTIAGMLGYGAGEATIASGSSGAATETEVMRMPLEKLQVHPEFKAAYGLTGDVEKARKMVADAAAGDAAAMTGISTFLLSAPFGALMGKFTAGIPLASTRARSIATGMAGEAGQEFLQSGAEQISQNLAIQQNADESRPLMQDVLNQAIGGAAAGGIMGGAFGSVSPLEMPKTNVDTNAPPAAPAAPPAPPVDPWANLSKPSTLPQPSTATPQFDVKRQGLLGVMNRHAYKGPAQILAEKRREVAAAGGSAVDQARAGATAMAEALSPPARDCQLLPPSLEIQNPPPEEPR